MGLADLKEYLTGIPKLLENPPTMRKESKKQKGTSNDKWTSLNSKEKPKTKDKVVTFCHYCKSISNRYKKIHNNADCYFYWLSISLKKITLGTHPKMKTESKGKNTSGRLLQCANHSDSNLDDVLGKDINNTVNFQSASITHPSPPPFKTNTPEMANISDSLNRGSDEKSEVGINTRPQYMKKEKNPYIVYL